MAKTKSKSAEAEALDELIETAKASGNPWHKHKWTKKEREESALFCQLPFIRDTRGEIYHADAGLSWWHVISANPYARMLLFDLAMQYRGDNNGDLCAAWKVMQPRGWRSEETLQKAKRDLIDLGLIVETRKGARPNKASLYAVTWCALDHCGGKLDISDKSFPRSAYRLLDPLPPIGKNASLTTAPVVVPTG